MNVLACAAQKTASPLVLIIAIGVVLVWGDYVHAQVVKALPVSSHSELQLGVVSEIHLETKDSSSLKKSEPIQFTEIKLQLLEMKALAHSPVIRQVLAEVQTARWRAVQAGLPANPEAGIDFQQLGSDGLAEQYGLSLSQEIISPEKLRLDRTLAQHEAKQLGQELEIARRRVLTDVHVLHVRGLRAARQVQITADLVEMGKRGVELSNELLQAREVGRADLLQAELEVESAIILNQNATHAESAVWRQIETLTGWSRPANSGLEGKIEVLPNPLVFEDCLDRIRTQSPEVTSAIARIDRERVNVRRQAIESKPNITIGGLFNWRDNGTGGDPNGGLVVSVPIPLWNKNQGAIGAARSQLVAAKRELDRVEQSIARRLANVFERYSNSAEQVIRFRNTILPKTQQTLELTRQSYELGEIGFINLLTIQRTYANNQLAYLESLESLRLAEIEIDGLLLADSLSELSIFE